MTDQEYDTLAIELDHLREDLAFLERLTLWPIYPETTKLIQARIDEIKSILACENVG